MSDQSTEDPVKSAIYHPKEFRQVGPRPTRWIAEQKKTQRHWKAVVAAAALVGAVAYYAGVQVQPGTPAPLPASGEFQRFYPATLAAPAPLKVSARNSTVHCFLKLEDWRTGSPVMTAFIRAGDDAAFTVPLGVYRLKYAHGTNWMGAAALFGPNTVSAQATVPMAFWVDGKQYRGHALDLTPRVYGNLRTAPVSAREF